jgi:hypothetical protein
MKMHEFLHSRTHCLLVAASIAFVPAQVWAQSNSAAAPVAAPVAAADRVAPRDGQHDFDFHFGTWKTHVSRLLHPLSGSAVWAQYDGTTVVRGIWHGRANLVELEADGTAGHLELASFRLYNPDSRQWSLNVTSSQAGALGVPTVGAFKQGRGEFFDQETFNGRAILVRFVVSDITPNSCHFEQAFSADGGRTWEVNWIAVDTRLAAENGPAR